MHLCKSMRVPLRNPFDEISVIVPLISLVIWIIYNMRTYLSVTDLSPLSGHLSPSPSHTHLPAAWVCTARSLGHACIMIKSYV